MPRGRKGGEAMETKIPEPQRPFLLRAPVYTPSITGLGDKADVVIRVDSLSSFRKPKLPIQVGLTLYRSGSGTWLVCVPFRIFDNPQDPLEGDTYLNPRQKEDYVLLEKLASQESFPFVFLSSDLGESVAKMIPWRNKRK